MEVIVSLVIGRGGSSFKNKNIRLVRGYPLILWTCAAAKRSKYINHYFCSSDNPIILNECKKINYIPIKRPNNLAKANSQSCDAVRHAISHIEKKIKKKIDILVLQHANVGTITGSMIDNCIDLLKKNSKASSVIPSHENNEYHPLRAKLLDSNGFLEQAIKKKSSANRQDLDRAFFFDHSFWVIKAKYAKRNDGQSPWNCMGKKIIPYETNGCFDVHNEEGLKATEEWLKINDIPDPII